MSVGVWCVADWLRFQNGTKNGMSVGVWSVADWLRFQNGTKWYVCRRVVCVCSFLATLLKWYVFRRVDVADWLRFQNGMSGGVWM